MRHLRPVTAWATFRFLKFISVALLTAGVWGSVFGHGPAARRRYSQRLATVGLLGVWLSGYALVKGSDASLGDPWISRTLLAGLVAYGASCWAGVQPLVRPASAGLAVGALTSAFGWMSARTQEHGWILGLAVPALAGLLAALIAARQTPVPDDDRLREPATLQWFAWIARAEGVSLLLLFGVYMPLKYGAGIVLDGGQGWFGWVHGAMQLTYLVALVVAARVLQWNGVRQLLGAIASLLPLGTFVFEHRVRRV